MSEEDDDDQKPDYEDLFSPSYCAPINTSDLGGEMASFGIRSGFDEGVQYRHWLRNVFSPLCVACRVRLNRYGTFKSSGQRVQRWGCKGCGYTMSRPLAVRKEACYELRKPRAQPKSISAPKSKQARYRHKMRLLGLCPKCGGKTDGFALCEAHRWYHRKVRQKKMVMRPPSAWRTSSG